ncbi:MAG: hypothetical protein ACK4RK_09200 [Gemmataceae bacterium]
MLRKTCWSVVALLLAVGTLTAAEPAKSLKKGTPDLKSAGPLAFGPEGILFVGDPQGAAIFAIDTQDRSASPASGPLKVAKVDEQIASLLGTTAQQILINDLAVNPASGAAYLSVARGKGPDAAALIVRVDRSGKPTVLTLENVPFAKASLPNASQKQRQEAITDLAYVDGKVLVAGLSNEQFASTLRAIPFPFSDADKGTSVEIYHGAHGKFETHSPVRTFVPYEISGQAHLLAAYTCTPLVKFPLSDLKPGAHVKGTTIAELGNRNRPLDMIVYQKGGKDYILMANSSRGVMKITTDGIDKIEGITNRISGTAGLTYDTIDHLKGVVQLDKLGKDNALLLIRADDGSLNLDTVPLP